MKIIAISLIAALIFAPSLANASEIRLLSDQQLCDNAPPLKQAAELSAERLSDKVVVSVTAELNCAYKAGKPEVRVWRNAATLLATTVSPSGMATACMCQHQMKYEITGLYEGARTIYYVQDGTVLGHVPAP